MDETISAWCCVVRTPGTSMVPKIAPTLCQSKSVPAQVSHESVFCTKVLYETSSKATPTPTLTYEMTPNTICGTPSKGTCKKNHDPSWGGGKKKYYSPDGTTVEDCKKACDQHADCAGFNYDRGKTRCYYRAVLAGGTTCHSKAHTTRDCYKKIGEIGGWVVGWSGTGGRLVGYGWSVGRVWVIGWSGAGGRLVGCGWSVGRVRVVGGSCTGSGPVKLGGQNYTIS